MSKIKNKLAWVFLLMIWGFLAVIGHVDANENAGTMLVEPVTSNLQDIAAVNSQETAEAQEINETELYAQAAVLMDAQSGRVLYGKGQDAVLAMASTTKIMTCIITLENADLSETAEVSSYAASMPEVKLGVRKGEQYQLGDLLYSLMLESHNDAAVVIAEHVGKQCLPEELRMKSVADYTAEESKQAVAAFAGMMNQKAKELGCENTWFITPNGLDAEEVVQTESGETLEKFHSTTAQELACIMSYCILDSQKSAEFLQITQTPSYTFSSANGRNFACYNHNTFLNMMSGAISGKTGFTNRAGYCYVGALERDGRTFVVALLACGWPYNKNYKWADTRKLMEYGVENYFYRSFQEGDTVVDPGWLEPIPVVGGQTDKLGEQAYVQVEIFKPGENAQEEGAHTSEKKEDDCGLTGLLMKAGEEIVVEYEKKKILTAPIEEGLTVGEVRYMVDGVTYRKEEIVTTQELEKIDWQWCLDRIFCRYLGFD